MSTLGGGGPLAGLVWAFRIHADGSAEELPVDKPLDHHHDGWLWLHFNLTDTLACQTLASIEALPQAAAALLVSPDEHQQLHATESCVYGVFADLVRNLEGATEEVGFLHFAMTDALLVSGRRHALSAVEATRQALCNGRKVASVAELLEAIVEHVADAIDVQAEKLAEELDRIEERILVALAGDERRRLGRVRRTTVRLHRPLSSFRILFHRMERELGAASKPLRLATNRLSQRLDGLDHVIVDLRDRAFLLQEEITFQIAERTNRHLQMLAIVTTLFLPASLVAGIFGMNTKGLPFGENEIGFVWAMVVLAGSSAIAFWALKRFGIYR